MFFETEFDPRNQAPNTGKKPRFEVAMTPPFNTNGFQAYVERE